MSKIPVTARPTIVSRYMSGESYDEIAADYGTTPQNIGFLLRTLKEKGDPLAEKLEFRKGRRRKEVAQAAREQANLPLEEAEPTKAKAAAPSAGTGAKAARITTARGKTTGARSKIAGETAAAKGGRAEAPEPAASATAKAGKSTRAARAKAAQADAAAEAATTPAAALDKAATTPKATFEKRAATKAGQRAKAAGAGKTVVAAQPDEVEPVVAKGRRSREGALVPAAIASEAVAEAPSPAGKRKQAAAKASKAVAEPKTTDEDWNKAAPRKASRKAPAQEATRGAPREAAREAATPPAGMESGRVAAAESATTETLRPTLRMPRQESDVKPTGRILPAIGATSSSQAAREEVRDPVERVGRRQAPEPVEAPEPTGTVDAIAGGNVSRFGEARRLVEAALALATSYERFVQSGDEHLIGTLNGEITLLRREMNAIEIDILR